jgi:hypothetical protein
MPSGCQFPQHHQSSGSGGGWSLVVVVAGAVLLGSSAAFASVVRDVMWLVLGVCGLVVVAGLGGMGLWLHHQRAMRFRPGEARRLVVEARMVERPAVAPMPRRVEVDGPYRYPERRAVDAARPVVRGQLDQRQAARRQIGGR